MYNVPKLINSALIIDIEFIINAYMSNKHEINTLTIDVFLVTLYKKTPRKAVSIHHPLPIISLFHSAMLTLNHSDPSIYPECLNQTKVS